MRPVRNRDAVGGAHTAEIPALHGALEALADGRAGDVDLLAGYIVVSGELRADLDQHIFRDLELGQLVLRLDLSLGEVAAHALGRVLRLLGAGAQLEGHVAVLVAGAVGDDLTAFEAEHGHRDVAAGFIEEAGHAEFLGEDAGSHRSHPP